MSSSGDRSAAPSYSPEPPSSGTLAGPYSRWALEARVVDVGSGVDRRASWFEVDGRRMPAEWDDEAGVLRWRPLRPPRRHAGAGICYHCSCAS